MKTFFEWLKSEGLDTGLNKALGDAIQKTVDDAILRSDQKKALQQKVQQDQKNRQNPQNPQQNSSAGTPPAGGQQKIDPKQLKDALLQAFK